jgi:hypothetical protein
MTSVTAEATPTTRVRRTDAEIAEEKEREQRWFTRFLALNYQEELRWVYRLHHLDGSAAIWDPLYDTMETYTAKDAFSDTGKTGETV